jgi:predicted nucleic acid-binding protein
MKKSTKSSTASRTFVDTSGFYAVLVRRDPMHTRANEFLAHAARTGRALVTSDYILAETATLLRARGHGHLAAGLFQTVSASHACQIEWMDPERFDQTRLFFLKHHDQSWSFTDCFSFVIMRALGLRDALTTDAHFRQAGFNPFLIWQYRPGF